MLDIKDLYLPKNLDDALRALKNIEGAKPLAAGTDIVVHLRHAVNTDITLVSLANLEELKGISMSENGDITIGAMTTFTALSESDMINRYLPVLKHAALTIAGPQIRNAATIGGNVANGAVSADSVPSLLVYDALANIVCLNGERQMPLVDFFKGPGKVHLEKGEILKSLTIPSDAIKTLKAHYIKYSTRKAMDLAVLGVAIAIAYDDNQIVTDFKLAMGVAAPTPIRLAKAEDFAKGKKLDKKTIDSIVDMALKGSKIRDSWRASKPYRSHLTGVLISDCIAEINQQYSKDA